MEVAFFSFGAISGLLLIILTIVSLGGHRDAGIWLGVAAGVAAVIGFGCWFQDFSWKKDQATQSRPAPIRFDAATADSQPADEKATADIADSTPNTDVQIVPSTPQSAERADLPDASSDNQRDPTPAEPAVDARPPHENPTPEYIARILSDKSGESREYVKKQFIGMRVSWQGRFNSVHSSGESASILVTSGLKDEVPYEPVFFSARVKPRKHKSLSLLQKGAPIRVDGIIESIEIGIPLLKDITAEVLPASNPKTNK